MPVRTEVPCVCLFRHTRKNKASLIKGLEPFQIIFCSNHFLTINIFAVDAFKPLDRIELPSNDYKSFVLPLNYRGILTTKE